MKRIGALLLGSFVFLCALFAAGCTDTTELQQQIDELKASQAEIQALKDEINSLKSQIDTNNQELQDQLNQATAKLATLEGKINGEPIKYLNEEDTATFVSNGIKLFDIQVMKGKYNDSADYVDFNFTSDLPTQMPNEIPFYLNSFVYDSSSGTLLKNTSFHVNSNIDQIYSFGKYTFQYLEHKTVVDTVFLFSGTNFVAAYRLEFISRVS